MGRRIASAGRVKKLIIWDADTWVDPASYPAWGGTLETYTSKLKDIGCTDLYTICWDGNGGWGWTSPVGGLSTKAGKTPDGTLQTLADLCHAKGIKLHGSFRTNWYGTSTTAAGYDLDPNSSGGSFVEVDQAGWADWIASVVSGLPGVVDIDGIGIDFIRTDATDLSLEAKKAPVKAVFDACYDALQAAHPGVEISTSTKPWIDANSTGAIQTTPQDNGRRAIDWYNDGRPHTVIQFDYGNNYNVNFGLPPNMDDMLSTKQATSHADADMMISSFAAANPQETGTDTSTFIPCLRAAQQHSNGSIAIFSASRLEFAYIETLRTMSLNGGRI